QIAALSGGRVLHDLSTTFTDRPPPVWAHDPLWPACLAISLLALLLSVALRRLVLPDVGALLDRLPAPVRRLLGRAAPRRPVHTGPQPEATLGALAAARDRARERDGKPGELAPEVARALAASPSEAKSAPKPGAAPEPDAPPKPAAPPPSLAE